MFSGLGLPELLVILAIVLVIFGGKKLPTIGKALGETIKGFRQGTREIRALEAEREETEEQEEQEEQEETGQEPELEATVEVEEEK
ncbi:MAG: twin-arginine translocase TatA/TatE family subunit [Candidatus Bipolaricaulia bacterium]